MLQVGPAVDVEHFDRRVLTAGRNLLSIRGERHGADIADVGSCLFAQEAE